MRAHPEIVRGHSTPQRLASRDSLAPTIADHPDSDVPDFSPAAWDAMLSFGFKGGFSTSFHDRKRKRFSAFLTSSRSSKQDITEIYDTFGGHIRSALIFFNEELIIKNLYRNGEIPALSERERECLLWVSAGHTTQQIADQLSLADRTVNEYISKATRKLHASNRAHACARSILLSLISP